MQLAALCDALRAQGLSLAHVVAFDRSRCIGKNNQLAWHVPEDLRHFKALTQGGAVVMGRKTFESIGKALPNRANWIVTRNPTFAAQGVRIAHNLPEALLGASQDVGENRALFVIGGGEIFAQSLPVVDTLFITRLAIDAHGDAFYPPIPDDFCLSERRQGQSQNGIAYAFETYKRQKPTRA